MAPKKAVKKESHLVSLADEDAVKEILVGTVLNLWEVVNDLTRLRPSKKDRYRVTIFGSARVPKGSWVFEEVKRLARTLSDMGCDIVTGGGPGLMQAANEGASEAGKAGLRRSMGIRIDLPFEQDANPFVEQAFTHRTFFTRLHQFVLMSDAFVVVPGGIGTALETLMVWQLLQVRHLDDRTPLILIGKMYSRLVDWAREHMLNPQFPLANPEDMKIPVCVNTADEAITVIRRHYAAWRKAQRRNKADVLPGR
ncbi:MAG: LOG family protein [Nitrospirae bacterium]|nr:LOG family protein [Nitrospirota bacterium]